MKTKMLLLGIPVLLLGFTIPSLFSNENISETKRTLASIDGCVFMTTMGEQSSAGFEVYNTDKNVQLSVRDGLSWLAASQATNGGYGAGSHSAQNVMDPLAVKTDPATTATVAMALLRSGNTLKKGAYSENLNKAINYLLKTVENTSNDSPYITEVRGTQIQSKLGQNIDAVMTAQLFSNLLDRNLKGMDKKRVIKALDICIAKIEAGTDENGKQKNAGWAGVLQSGLATSALESAQAVGANVDEEVITKSRDYQKGNYNEETGDISTADGAGVMLYAVSGSVRGTAKDARKAKELIAKAKKEGKLINEEVNVKNLLQAGMNDAEAAAYTTSYNVYNAAKKRAQDEDVLNGFGNNGGEEFLSFLQTGESLVVNKDDDWKDWYKSMSGRILKIQNEDGSWNGHHCITSPVFCTATSVLLLTVENDIDFLSKVGKD